jgi:hypothetical protein
MEAANTQAAPQSWRILEEESEESVPLVYILEKRKNDCHCSASKQKEPALRKI